MGKTSVYIYMYLLKKNTVWSIYLEKLKEDEDFTLCIRFIFQLKLHGFILYVEHCRNLQVHYVSMSLTRQITNLNIHRTNKCFYHLYMCRKGNGLGSDLIFSCLFPNGANFCSLHSRWSMPINIGEHERALVYHSSLQCNQVGKKSEKLKNSISIHSIQLWMLSRSNIVNNYTTHVFTFNYKFNTF